MPVLETAKLNVDPATLCIVTVFVAASGGLLLLFAWLQNRNERALALWGTGYLTGSLGAGLLPLHGVVSDAWSVGMANTLICCAYGIMWAGARSFEGRRVSIAATFAGAMVWLTAYHSPMLGSPELKVQCTSAILAVYTLLGAREVWYGRDPELISRWPTLVVIVVHALCLLARIPSAGILSSHAAAAGPRLPVLMMAFEALFATFCLAILRVSMAKERAELAQRKTALTDSLTGIANRRAFFDRGATLLEQGRAGNRSTVLLLFDLDRFKEVNDTAGHQAGDRVLAGFAAMAVEVLPADALFARVGGEEFACLLPEASMASALQLAENMRRRFAGLHFSDLPMQLTVSVGIAMERESGSGLSSLLATADRALYRAKSEGRNRVARAPLVVVEARGAENRHVGAGAARPGAAPVPLWH